MQFSQTTNSYYCLDMHSKDACSIGETDRCSHALNAWHKINLYTEKECQAIALEQTNTLIQQQDISDDLYTSVRAHFSEEQ